MRCLLLLISLCVAYTPATSQGLSKPCVKKENTNGIYSTRYKGCWIHGVCQPYGKKIKQALSCMVYVCERKGDLSNVRYEATGCRLNHRCYRSGKIINLKTCNRLTCTYSSFTGYKWKKEPTGCSFHHKCYQPGETVTESKCVRRTCMDLMTGYEWKREFTGCIYNNVCYKTGKKYKLKQCRYGICKKLRNGYYFSEKLMGCPINGQCLPIGERKRSKCFDLYCRKIRNGVLLETTYKSCS
ncbi:uncharacterized protein LOC115222431 isoform X2 [Octopus sinensis]|uniref:Uncharacterized protein LOC115222431 isoform X2 n=1 Tax=Octopus sinensis TaxID=2607531 RepID=A0A6P7TDU7_9MOLL|nr:uncharacterized protein LOC115222431 isoform X2 [Octopus sinensis]